LREWFKEDKSQDKIVLNNLDLICNSTVLTQILSENAKGVRDNGNFIWTLLMIENMISV
jgi:hypothetical protein